MHPMTVAVDLAQDVFEVAVSRGQGDIDHRARWTRRPFAAFVDTLAPSTVVVMEACGSAHYWGRRCASRGAIVRLLPPAYVRPYVRRNKTDRTDTEALLEAHRCGGIDAVPVKTIEQQTIQALHRVRQHWQKTRTARLNLMRAIGRELGVVFPRGAVALQRHVARLVAEADGSLPIMTCELMRGLLDEVRGLERQLAQLDARLADVARTHPIAARLLQIPGIGIITATALIGTVSHIHAFRSGRRFASWLGLTPRETSSGMRRVLGAISKRGDRYLRTLLAHGARAVLCAALTRARRDQPLSRLATWALALADRRGRNRATIGVANKLARLIWVLWSRDVDFQDRPMAA